MKLQENRILIQEMVTHRQHFLQVSIDTGSLSYRAILILYYKKADK